MKIVEEATDGRNAKLASALVDAKREGNRVRREYLQRVTNVVERENALRIREKVVADIEAEHQLRMREQQTAVRREKAKLFRQDRLLKSAKAKVRRSQRVLAKRQTEAEKVLRIGEADLASRMVEFLKFCTEERGMIANEMQQMRAEQAAGWSAIQSADAELKAREAAVEALRQSFTDMYFLFLCFYYFHLESLKKYIVIKHE
jgi:hypothetical protein